MIWATIVSTATKWVLHLFAGVGLLGLTWCAAHHQGAASQRAKDAPVIVAAKADAATGQAQAALTTVTLQAAAKREDQERNNQEKVHYVVQGVDALADARTPLPADLDARWRSGIASLRDDPADNPADGQGSGVPSGPGPQGTAPQASPTS